jgi:CBS-domain-containing membrane protein
VKYFFTCFSLKHTPLPTLSDVCETTEKSARLSSIGVTTYKILSPHMWLAASVSVATAIAVMHATKILHPPGGATALIAVIGSQKIHSLGYLYVLVPAGLGAAIMLLIALLVNNIPKNRRYPEYWI